MYISQDPIGLNGGITLYSYVCNTNAWVDRLGLYNNGTEASNAADKYRTQSKNERPSNVAVIVTTDGRRYEATSGQGLHNQEVQTQLDNLGNTNAFDRQCAEVNAISLARNDDANLDGATIFVSHIRGANGSDEKHGSAHDPCDVCGPLIEEYGMEYDPGCP